jgi:hypothetical protein
VPKHRRHAAASPADGDAATGPSLLEIALYGVLGAAVAAAVLVVGGQPTWQPVAVVTAALVLLGLAIFSSTPSRHGRRRRR